MQSLTKHSDMTVYIKSLLNEGLCLPYYNVVRLLEVYNYTLYSIKFIEPKNGQSRLTISNIYETKEGINLVIFEKSWADYLPLVLKNDVLKDFLYGFQLTMFKQIAVIDNIEELFMPEQTPEELVSWLGLWFNISFSNEIKLENRKKILYKLSNLYNAKGTRKYLIEMVQLLTDISIEINERAIPPDELINTNKNLSFIVRIKQEIEYANAQEHIRIHQVIKNIIETEKPIFAHAYFDETFKFDDRKPILSPIIKEQEVIYKEDTELKEIVNTSQKEKKEVDDDFF